jgi:cytochrome P450
MSTTSVDLDISARSFWAKPFEEREQTFAWFRANEPVSYRRPYESTLVPPDENTPGFWALSKYEDMRAVSRDTETFCSVKGILMEDFPYEVQVATTSFLAMDAPEHTQLRGIVKTAFTPRNVRKIDDWVDDHARELVDEMIELGEGDFCNLFAKHLPGRIFAHFFGLPPGSEGGEIIMDAAEKMLAWDDPECAQGRDAATTFTEESMRIQKVALEVAEEKRKNPGEDLVSWVLGADFEGRKMEDAEIAAFFSLLGSAANDTTRHTTAHAVRLFSEHPDQLELLKEDMEGRLDGAVEEVLRHATPVMQFRRTATQDTQIRDVDIAAGDKVVLWYCSGNRDEEIFDDASRFDILRDPNKHLGFGAGGAHYCMGAAMGRQMVKSALRELYTRMPDLTLDGEPSFQINNFMHGVHAMPVRWTPSSA